MANAIIDNFEWDSNNPQASAIALLTMLDNLEIDWSSKIRSRQEIRTTDIVRLSDWEVLALNRDFDLTAENTELTWFDPVQQRIEANLISVKEANVAQQPAIGPGRIEYEYPFAQLESRLDQYSPMYFQDTVTMRFDGYLAFRSFWMVENLNTLDPNDVFFRIGATTYTVPMQQTIQTGVPSPTQESFYPLYFMFPDQLTAGDYAVEIEVNSLGFTPPFDNAAYELCYGDIDPDWNFVSPPLSRFEKVYV